MTYQGLSIEYTWTTVKSNTLHGEETGIQSCAMQVVCWRKVPEQHSTTARLPAFNIFMASWQKLRHSSQVSVCAPSTRCSRPSWRPLGQKRGGHDGGHIPQKSDKSKHRILMKYDIWFQIMIRYELGSVQHHYNLQIDAKSVELLDWELWLLSTWIWNSSTDWFISWDILGSSEVVVVGFSDSYVFRIFFKVPKFWVSGVVRIACPKKTWALHDFGVISSMLWWF